MRVAAHQPHTFPWLGFLDKIEHCDMFVLMDDLQFESQNFQNRNRVKVNNGTTWLTVPLLRGSQSQRICDKQILNARGSKDHWQRRIHLTLETHYGRAAHYDRYANELARVFSTPFDSLLAFNLQMIALCCEWFQIRTPVMLASRLGLTGQRTERILQMCKRVGADVYVSGRGGSTDYLDAAAFAEAGVSLQWQHFSHPVYAQRYPGLGFIKNLAALDLLFNCGSQSRGVLFPTHKEEGHGATI